MQRPCARWARRRFSATRPQLAPYLTSIVGAPAVLARYGLWTCVQQVGGLVRVGLVSGKTGLAMSCATCHVRSEKGQLLIGAPNQYLELGALMHDTDDRLTPARREAAGGVGSGPRRRDDSDRRRASAHSRSAIDALFNPLAAHRLGGSARCGEPGDPARDAAHHGAQRSRAAAARRWRWDLPCIWIRWPIPCRCARR